MPFGDIFVGTFRQIWQHKKLWLFGLLAALLSSVGLGIYQLFGLRWQNNYMELMSRAMQGGSFDWPRRFAFETLSSLGALGLGLILLLLFSLVGYIISLIMRGAIMHEAAHAWAGGPTDTSRGVSAGAGRAVHIFLIDLLWSLLPALIIGGALVTAFALMMTTIVLGSNENVGGLLAVLFIGFLCALVCVAFLLVVFVSLFPPLMYQSAVVGRRSVGEAIAEGWRLTVANLGGLVIFWLLLLLLNFVLGLLVQAIMLPLTLPWMGTWMTDWTGAMERFMQGGQPDLPPLRIGWLVISGLVSVALSLLMNSFMLTFRHTLYAEVYRRLTGAVPPVVPAAPVTPPPAPVAPIAPVPVAPPPVIVPEEPSVEGEEPPRVA